jgi:hypothetical protein
MGYDPQFGARPLKRVIQGEGENRLARGILDGTIHDGDRVEIDAQNGKLVMESVREQAQEEACSPRQREAYKNRIRIMQAIDLAIVALRALELKDVNTPASLLSDDFVGQGLLPQHVQKRSIST